MQLHTIDPVFDTDSRVLILGSFPSVASRETGFFYGHPQNRFWRVTAAVMEENMPVTIEEKRAFLLRSHIALWDVIAACEINGSADSTIRNAVPVDLTPILEVARIEQIFVNGKTAEKYYNVYLRDTVGRDAIVLPSTSPANAAWSVERLIDAWQVIRSGDA